MTTTTNQSTMERWRSLALAALRRAGRADDDTTPEDVERLLTTTTYDDIAVAALYRPGDGPARWSRATRTGAWEVRQRQAEPGEGIDSIWVTAVENLAQIPRDGTGVAVDSGGERLLAAAGDATLTGSLGAAADTVAGLAVRCAAECPGLRAGVVDATRWHDAGAAEADELAASIATGVAYLRLMTGAGLDVADAFEQLEFRYAATTEQFATIAKLRAARRLWARVAQECGVTAAQRQHAVTSTAMMTARDPWTNILRTTVAGFAAAVGGADVITVQPYDLCLGAPDPSAVRLVRNTQAVLREEAHLARVVDPAGGSWYVESLTEELAGRAWAAFTDIERIGSTEALAARVEQTRRRREHDVATRRAPIIGVSEFPDLGETPLTRTPAPSPAVRRHAMPFERLRDRAESHPRRPRVRLVPIGRAQARLGFAADLFAAGGIEATEDATESPVVCLCGDDDAYAQHATRLAAELTAAGARHVWLAGRPGRYAGVDGYLHLGCDALAVLETTFEKLEATR